MGSEMCIRDRLEVFTSAGVGTQVVPDAEPTAPTTPEEDA